MIDIDWDRWLRPGDRIVCSHMSAEPVALLQDLSLHASGMGLQIFLGVPFSDASLGLPTDCKLVTYGGMGAAASLLNTHEVLVSPLQYSFSETVFERGQWHCDIVLVSLAQDGEGNLWLGASHGPVLAAARKARHVIAQINDLAPCVLGAVWPIDIKIDAFCHVSHPPTPYLNTSPGSEELTIGQWIASLIQNGSCLQLGIGSVPTAVLRGLQNHRHLGIHSGMFTDDAMALMQLGVIDNSQKSADAGVAVVGAIIGSQRLYDFANLNKAFELRSPSRTHSLEAISRQDKFFSINGAIEVDLLGQVNAETIKTPTGRWRLLGGQGGASDFVRGARMAFQGRSVIALPSRSPKGKARIVPRIEGPCTVAMSDVDMVVTEYGVAHLKDAYWSDRVRAMLSIAHPDDRERLAFESRAMGLS